MLAFSGLVAGSFSLGHIVANEIEPAALNAVRFVIAAAAIGLFMVSTGGLSRKDLRAPWRYLMLGALLAGYFIAMFEGLKIAPPVSTSAVFTLTPIFSAAFGYMLLRQRVTPRISLALVMGAFGAIWVIFRADIGAILRVDVGRGETIFFFGVVAHAFYTPLVRRINRGERPVVMAFLTTVAGLVVLSAVGANDLIQTDFVTLRPIVWITIIYVALFATAVTFVLLQFASLNLPSSKVMAYTYLTPSWVIAWELALGAAPPPGLVILGIGATLLALLLLLRDDEVARPQT